MGIQEKELTSKRFIDELNHRQPNAKLTNANRDLESLMAGRDRRASKYGITIDEKFDDYGKYSENSSYKDDRYIVSHDKFYLQHAINFMKDNKSIYQHESYRIHADLDVIDLLDPSKLPSEAYVCPNCGTISSAEELASIGCSYCGAHFSIPELYPKVSHFSYSEGSTDLSKDVPRTIKKPILIAWAVAYFPLFLLGLGMVDNGILATIFIEIALMFVAAIPAFFVYAILSYVVSITTMYSDKQQRNRRKVADIKTSNSNELFEKTMAQYSPIFNFQYFSSRVYNLLGSMIYAENINECPFYSGPNFIGYFDYIIDYVPIGMDIVSFGVDEQGKCTIAAKVIADTYCYVNGRITHNKAEFILKTSKNMNYPIDINFSAHTYKCDGCGANYDVTKAQVCPYCGRPHDLLDEEWYIDGPVECKF